VERLKGGIRVKKAILEKNGVFRLTFYCFNFPRVKIRVPYIIYLPPTLLSSRGNWMIYSTCIQSLPWNFDGLNLFYTPAVKDSKFK
jgi:hypothetical protein